MARKFMKIRRVVIPFITLVILTSQLAGCATLTSQEMLEESRRTPEVVLEYSELDTSQQDMDGKQIQIGDEVYEFEGDNSAIGIVDNQQEQDQAELSGDELIKYFQLTYDSSKVAENDSLEEQIKFELFILDTLCTNDNKKLPADYEAQYRAWRPVDEQSSNQQQAPEVTLTFTEVNEQVWATGIVNLRSGPSTEDEKVGALNKGNSVTRIGIGTGDYASWSKVKLSDGSEVYVASSYLTTTKPTTQSSSKPSGSSTTSNNQNQTQNQTQQPSKPSSGGKDIYDGFSTYEEYITDICKQFPNKTREELERIFPDQATGHTDVGAANQDAAAGLFNH